MYDESTLCSLEKLKSARRFSIKVDLPTPSGPEMTIKQGLDL